MAVFRVSKQQFGEIIYCIYSGMQDFGHNKNISHCIKLHFKAKMAYFDRKIHYTDKIIRTPTITATVISMTPDFKVTGIHSFQSSWKAFQKIIEGLREFYKCNFVGQKDLTCHSCPSSSQRCLMYVKFSIPKSLWTLLYGLLLLCWWRQNDIIMFSLGSGLELVKEYLKATLKLVFWASHQ